MTEPIIPAADIGKLAAPKSAAGMWVTYCHMLGSIWLIEADSPLQYRRLVSMDAATGEDRHVELEETDVEANLSLEPALKGCLFLIAERPTWKALFHIAGQGDVRRLSPEGVVFAPQPW